MNTTQELILTRGIPASGKSTWAEKWVQEDPTKRVRVNRDEIRWALSKDLYGTPSWQILDEKGNPSKEFEGQVTNVETTLIKRALKEGKSVVSDNTNLHWKPQRWMLDAKRKGIKITVKEFPISLEEAIHRNNNRDRVVPEDVIRRMYNRLGPNGEFHHIDGTFELQKFIPPVKKGQHAIGVDLDGTLADVRGVRHFLNRDSKGRRDFNMFHRSSLFVPPNDDVVQILKDAQKNGIAVLITTARSAEYAEVSQRWLHENGITFDNYYCRPKGDYRPDYEVKKDIFDEISKHYDLIHQIDDNPPAVRAFEEKGVLVTKVKFYGENSTAEEMVEKIVVKNPFSNGGCLRCGKPISKGYIGPRCAMKQ